MFIISGHLYQTSMPDISLHISKLSYTKKIPEKPKSKNQTTTKTATFVVVAISNLHLRAIVSPTVKSNPVNSQKITRKPKKSLLMFCQFVEGKQ